MKPLLHQKLYYLLFALFMTGIAWWLMGRETTEPLAAFKDEASATGEKPDERYLDFPTVDEGVRGMAFIKTVVAASKSDQTWYPYEEY